MRPARESSRSPLARVRPRAGPSPSCEHAAMSHRAARVDAFALVVSPRFAALDPQSRGSAPEVSLSRHPRSRLEPQRRRAPRRRALAHAARAGAALAVTLVVAAFRTCLLASGLSSQRDGIRPPEALSTHFGLPQGMRVRKSQRLFRGNVDEPKYGEATIALTRPARDAILGLPRDGRFVFRSITESECRSPVFLDTGGK